MNTEKLKINKCPMPMCGGKCSLYMGDKDLNEGYETYVVGCQKCQYTTNGYRSEDRAVSIHNSIVSIDDRKLNLLKKKYLETGRWNEIMEIISMLKGEKQPLT